METYKKNSEAALLWIEAIASFAYSHHPGCFVDGAIENIALEMGRNLKDCFFTDTSKSLQQQVSRLLRRRGKRRILHVTPRVFHVGGHTQTIKNWIRNDPDSQHSLLQTRLGYVNDKSHAWLRDDVHNSGGEFIVLTEPVGLLAKARMMRVIAQSCADCIILHHTCNDITPVVAFATQALPPVAFVNDCDQAFWLGSSVADVIINQREAGERLSKQRRFTTCNKVLPIPLSESQPCLSRHAARQELGISFDHLILLTVGRSLKYRPTQSRDFFRTVRQILDKVKEAHLYVIGLSELEAFQWKLYSQHPRIHLCGTITNTKLAMYHVAADLYLESFPFGSSTALLEAAIAGLPVVLPFAPILDLLVTNHGLEDILSHANNEKEYIELVILLLENFQERERLGKVVRDHVRSEHTGEGWKRQVSDVYHLIESCNHDIKHIPIADYSISNDVDIILSEWHSFLDDRFDPVSTVRDKVFNAAYTARDCHDHMGAFKLLWWYLYTYGFDREILIFAAKLPVHRIYRQWYPKTIAID